MLYKIDVYSKTVCKSKPYQNHKSNQIVLQIWGWYLKTCCERMQETCKKMQMFCQQSFTLYIKKKKKAFSKCLFVCSSMFALEL